MIDWGAFLIVFAAALVGTAIAVTLYASGLRLLVRAGRVPVVTPVEFTDAITVLSPAQVAAAEKKAAKAAKKNPLSDGQRRFALVCAYGCFALCGLVVLYGVYLIVPALHGG